jgi:hypothetical protein
VVQVSRRLAAGAVPEIEEIEVGEKSIWQATQTV